MPEKAPFFFDAVTVSNFAMASRLDILLDRYGTRACVPPDVRSELAEGIAAGYRRLEPVETALREGRLGAVEAMSGDERRVQQELLRALSPGEASCIACARARGGTVVTDDRAARGHCEEWGVPVTGTIGILRACVRDGMLAAREADRILQDMIDGGYYSPVRRISDLG